MNSYIYLCHNQRVDHKVRMRGATFSKYELKSKSVSVTTSYYLPYPLATLFSMKHIEPES